MEYLISTLLPKRASSWLISKCITGLDYYGNCRDNDDLNQGDVSKNVSSLQANNNILFFIGFYFLLTPSLIALFHFSNLPIAILLSLSVVLFETLAILPLFPLEHNFFSNIIKNSWIYFIFACAVIWLSGVLPPFVLNSDWTKHYAILNTLVDEEWPPVINTLDDLPPEDFKEIYGFALTDRVSLESIKKLYTSLLNRLPDQKGLDYWVNVGVHNIDCYRALINSPEYKNSFVATGDSNLQKSRFEANSQGLQNADDKFRPYVMNRSFTLRYYISYYIIPAIFGKLFGSSAAILSTYLFTVIGFFIALILVFGVQSRSPSEIFLLGLFFIFFSGADIVGSYVTNNLPDPRFLHFEWWFRHGVLSSQITSIFWGPQHALPSTISVFMILRNPRLSLNYIGVLVSAIFMWSPFSAIGIIPFFIWALVNVGWKYLLSTSNFIAAPILLVLTLKYLLTGSSAIPMGFLFQKTDFNFLFWILFILVEFLLYGFILYLGSPRNRALVITCCSFLGVLSLEYFGNYNDLLMRSSISSLAVMAAISSFFIVYSKNYKAKILLIITYLVGVITPVSEIWRGSSEIRDSKVENFSMDDFLELAPEVKYQYLVASASNNLSMTKKFDAEDFSYTSYGTAEFDIKQPRVSSDVFTDAGLITDNFYLPKGRYLIRATLSVDAISKLEGANSAYVATYEKDILFSFKNIKLTNKKVSILYKSRGEKTRLAFGLGAGSEGRGYIELKNLQIYSID